MFAPSMVKSGQWHRYTNKMGLTHMTWQLAVPCTTPGSGLLLVCKHWGDNDSQWNHYNNIIMSTITSQITSLMIVYSTVYSDTDQRKHQSSVSLAFVWGIHRALVNSPRKWPVTRNMSLFDDVIMFPDCWCKNIVKLEGMIYFCLILDDDKNILNLNFFNLTVSC